MWCTGLMWCSGGVEGGGCSSVGWRHAVISVVHLIACLPQHVGNFHLLYTDTLHHTAHMQAVTRSCPATHVHTHTHTPAACLCGPRHASTHASSGTVSSPASEPLNPLPLVVQAAHIPQTGPGLCMTCTCPHVTSCTVLTPSSPFSESTSPFKSPLPFPFYTAWGTPAPTPPPPGPAHCTAPGEGCRFHVQC